MGEKARAGSFSGRDIMEDKNYSEHVGSQIDEEVRIIIEASYEQGTRDTDAEQAQYGYDSRSSSGKKKCSKAVSSMRLWKVYSVKPRQK